VLCELDIPVTLLHFIPSACSLCSGFTPSVCIADIYAICFDIIGHLQIYQLVLQGGPYKATDTALILVFMCCSHERDQFYGFVCRNVFCSGV
jgi:hypothetical protein